VSARRCTMVLVWTSKAGFSAVGHDASTSTKSPCEDITEGFAGE
jgi:hypothetical protein